MGLDITVYVNARPATANEIAAIGGEKDRAAALVALDKLESEGRFTGTRYDGWRREWIERARLSMMNDEAPPVDRVEMAEALDLVIPYINPDFSARASDLTATAYSAEVADINIHFTYSGYNRWREWLASIAGLVVPGVPASASLNDWWAECDAIEARGETPSIRFWQLLHFSDCEGAIGPAVCKLLADDFDAMAEVAERSWSEAWQLQGYREWRKAFREAGDTGGWVSFH
jgi:hypothetical protein